MPRVIFQTKNKEGYLIQVIETPCYPAKYYSGFIFNGVQATNCTNNYFKTVESAIENAIELERRVY